MKHLPLLILLLFPLLATAQTDDRTPDSQSQDSVLVLQDMDDFFASADSTSLRREQFWNGWRPDPARATWLAVIVPGLGQIYNRSYWKLPIVYGGFMGCAYAITWNSRMYSDYREAYRDILTDTEVSTDPNRSYNAILPKGYTVESMGGKEQYTATLKSRQNLYRRYRDISIAVTALVYVLTIVDAYVDAQLFDFDISPDLSLNVEPQIYYNPQMQRQRSAEVKVAFKF
ncbi:MAG: hypothetical protein IJS00_02350 [Paludibacteraceae bacterium]|nr:hypothetical protein [Paludibacteraceae bacterium]